MQDFKQLKVWEKAHNLTLDVYGVTATFPREELYGLTSQARRCSASIPTNIAEGCGKNSNVDFARHIQIAIGSASELEYHLLLSKDLGLLDEVKYQQLVESVVEVRKMLIAFVTALRTTKPNLRLTAHSS